MDEWISIFTSPEANSLVQKVKGNNATKCEWSEHFRCGDMGPSEAAGFIMIRNAFSWIFDKVL